MHPGDAGRTRHAAQPHQRHPAHVLAQPHLGGDARVERGDRQARHRRGHDQVDVGGRQVGGLERVDEGARPELDGVLDELVVGVAEVLEPGVVLQRQHRVAPLDAGVAVEAPQQGVVEAALGDHLGEGLGDLGLRMGVRRQRTSDGEDPHVSYLDVIGTGAGRTGGTGGRGRRAGRLPGGGRCGRRRGRARRACRRRGGRGRRRGCRRRRSAGDCASREASQVWRRWVPSIARTTVRCRSPASSPRPRATARAAVRPAAMPVATA